MHTAHPNLRACKSLQSGTAFRPPGSGGTVEERIKHRTINNASTSYNAW